MLSDAASIPAPALQRLLRRCRADPLWFCRNVLGGQPWSRQAEIMLAVRDHPRVTVRSGHGVGKSWTAAAATLWFLYAFPPSIVITLAPTWRQVQQVLWAEIRRSQRGALVPLLGQPRRTRLELADNWYASGLATNAAERLQGIHGPHVLVVMDEAPGIAPELFQAAEGLMTGPHARMLLIGNPTRAEGPFYDTFKGGGLWHTIHISSVEAVAPGLVSAGWVEERAEEWGEASPLYLSRVLGEFPEDASSALLTREEVSAASANGDLPAAGEQTMGVDVARFGDDETVIAVVRWHENRGHVVALKAWHGRDLMESSGEVVRAMRQWKVRPGAVLVDDTGLGGGLVDRLTEEGHEVVPVNFGSAARDRGRYFNRRAEMLFGMARAVREGRLLVVHDDELARELRALRYEIRSDGRVAVPKGKGKSPDRAEALALACYETAEPRALSIGGPPEGGSFFGVTRSGAQPEPVISHPDVGRPPE